MANGPFLSRPPEGAGRGDDALQRAMHALNGGRPVEAEHIAGEVLRNHPRQARALHIFGCALLMQGRAKDAIAPLETAARDRHDPEVETQLAIALRQTGRFDDAVSRLKRAIKRRPPFPAAFHELGCLLSFMKRYDEAIEVFNRGVEIAPMMSELSVQLGFVFLQRRKWANAKAAFERALAIAPESREALFGMAKSHQEAGEYRAAAECYRRSLMNRPDPRTWHNLGRCLLMTGELDAAYDCFRWAVRGDPQRYGNVLGSLVKSPRGRFWLKPSAAARFLREPKS
jgi:tetratricopeptide (TPR) repeat protein